MKPQKNEAKFDLNDLPWLYIALVAFVVLSLIYLSAMPFRSDLHFKIAKTAADYRNNNEALNELVKTTSIVPFESNFNTYYGLFLLNSSGDLLGRQKAISILKRAALIDPYNADNFNLLGRAYLMFGDLGVKDPLEESINYFKNALAIDPYYAEVYLSLGMAYESKNRYEEALKMYKKVFNINPDLDEGYNRYIDLCRRQGRINECISALKEEVEKYPGFLTPKKYLAKVYSQTGQSSKALELYSEMKKNSSNNVIALIGLGDSYFSEGLLDKAQEAYLEAAYIDPMNVDSHRGLGNVYLRKGLKDKARSEFEQVLTIDPNNEYAKRMLGIK